MGRHRGDGIGVADVAEAFSIERTCLTEWIRLGYVKTKMVPSKPGVRRIFSRDEAIATGIFAKVVKHLSRQTAAECFRAVVRGTPSNMFRHSGVYENTGVRVAVEIPIAPLARRLDEVCP